MDQEHLRDLFSGIGPISIRRMFGGLGIYSDGMIFALVLRDRLMLKGDDQTAADYEAARMERWVYENSKSKKPVAMPYWSAPESALDDPDEMTDWARMAIGASRRSAK